MWSTPGQLEVNCLLDEVCVLIFVHQHMGNPWLIDITSDTVPETLPGRRLKELEKTELQLREIAAMLTGEVRLILLVKVRKTCDRRSEEHTSELQTLMRRSYADFCLKKKPAIV